MWSKKYKQCVVCKSTKRRHMAKGCCDRCYMRRYVAARSSNIAEYKRNWYISRRDKELAAKKITRERVHFDSVRETVLARDGHQCTVCKATHNLVVHHKDRTGRGSTVHNNTLDNLVTMCRKHHLAEHRAEYLEIRRRKHTTPKLLKSGRWSTNYDNCIDCGRNTSVYAAKGLCTACYQKPANSNAR